jgi:benzoate 4-monooxygenase
LGHGNGFAKSDFYSAFDNIEDNIFTTRDRLKHGRKRKIVSHMFSPKSMVSFEPYITKALGIFSIQMDSLIDSGRAGKYVDLAENNHEIESRKSKDEGCLDVAQWAAFLAFDIIGDLVSKSWNAFKYNSSS